VAAEGQFHFRGLAALRPGSSVHRRDDAGSHRPTPGIPGAERSRGHLAQGLRRHQARHPRSNHNRVPNLQLDARPIVSHISARQPFVVSPLKVDPQVPTHGPRTINLFIASASGSQRRIPGPTLHTSRRSECLEICCEQVFLDEMSSCFGRCLGANRCMLLAWKR
jgi:hypothetical protein